MIRKFYPLLLLLLLTVPAIIFPSYAEEEGQNSTTARIYSVYWEKIHVGDLIGEVKTHDGRSEFRVMLRSLNILKSLTKYTSNSFTIAEYSTDKLFVPRSFDTTSILRKKSKHTRLTYNEAGLISSENVSHPANPQNAKPVTPTMKEQAVDPLTAALIAREKVRLHREHKGTAEFIIPVYNGKHFFEIHFTIREKTTIRFGERSVAVIPLRFSRQAVAGFSKKELQDMKKEDPVIDVYLSDDALLLPLQAEGKAPLGKATALLLKECKLFNECL